MSKNMLAVVLAIYTSLGWGMIAPMAVRMSQHLGPEKFHPALPFIWNTFGGIFFSLLLLFSTNFAPLKFWSWHWSGWVIFLSWPSASIAIAYGFYYAPTRVATINAIAATYPALVSAMILWHFFGETMSIQKIIGLLMTVAGVIVVLLS